VVLWGTYRLASFNFVLDLIPNELRARYSALYHLVVPLALSGGAALGSLVIAPIGYKGVFLVSALGRIIASLMFVRFVHPTSYFSVFKPTRILFVFGCYTCNLRDQTNCMNISSFYLYKTAKMSYLGSVVHEGNFGRW
jgi:MFS family permease